MLKVDQNIYVFFSTCFFFDFWSSFKDRLRSNKFKYFSSILL